MSEPVTFSGSCPFLIEDHASVAGPLLVLLESGVVVHCLRDLTRGGLTAALNEIASAAGVGVDIDEVAVPVRAMSLPPLSPRGRPSGRLRFSGALM